MSEARGVGLRMRRVRSAWRVPLVSVIALVLSLLAGNLSAQTVTGQISGTVTDSSGAVIVGAKVDLTYGLSGQMHEVVTGASGDFTFPELIPGSYNLSITQQGFKTYEQKDISVSASERVALHQIQLVLGNVTTEVSVTSDAARVETDSSEHSSLVSEAQMTNVTVKGRNYLSYVALLPGVTTSGQADAPGWGNTDGLSINGGNSTVLIQLDGIASQDDGINGATAYLAPSADAIAEMKVQTGNFNAEYGARNGGTINVIIKNGTKDLHGSAFYYGRNNFFNANNFFNKESTLPSVANHPADYKFANPGGTLGGPVIIPHTGFNKNRDKLFFFFSADLLSRTVPTSLTGPTDLTMPTVAEREGNFMGDVTGGAGVNPISIHCPGGAALSPTAAANLATACGSPSAGGIALMNLLPLPTCNSTFDAALNQNPGLNIPSCGTNAYNWQGLLNQPEPRSDYILRLDYNPSKNELFYVRWLKDYQAQNGGTFLGGSGWPGQLETTYFIHSTGVVATLVSTIRPNVVNEFTAGYNRAFQQTFPWNAANLKSEQRDNPAGVSCPNSPIACTLGPSGLPVLFPDATSTFGANAQSPDANPYDVVPNAQFTSTGLLSAPSYNIEGRFPFYGTDTTYNVVDNVTWVKGAHALKFGIYYEQTSRNGPSGGGGGVFNGSINFSQSGTNPVDTGFSYSNAFLGAFQSYSEESDKPHGYDRIHGIEWFAQDTWKITRRLTLDYGVRFQLLTPVYDTVTTSDFQPGLYNSALQPPLIQPCMVGGARAGCYGAATFPVGAIGSFVPSANQTGTPVLPFQGMEAFSPYAPIVKTPPLGIGPRVGIAWDVFGDGKTALRSGFGIGYNKYGVVDTAGQLVLQPPPPSSQPLASPPTSSQQLVETPVDFNTTLPQLLAGGAQAYLSPQNVIGLNRTIKSPALYSWSLGVQHDLGHGLLVDISYVGNVGRHNYTGSTAGYNLNLVPYGADFLTNGGTYLLGATPTATGSTAVKYQDPTKGPGTVLPSNFERPMPGYGDITEVVTNLNSNYNSLQSSINKRFGRSLTMNAGWTWAKVLGYNAQTEPNVPAREYYGLQSGYRKHTLGVNWTYKLPKAGVENAFAKEALNGWVLSGIFAYETGAPGTVTVSGGTDLTGADGTGVLTRPEVFGNPNFGTHITYNSLGQEVVTFLNLGAFEAPPGGVSTCNGVYTNCGVGNSGLTNFIGAPINNWNISLFKDFQLGKTEGRTLEFRWETYNAFNHTQFGNGTNGGFASTTLNLSTANTLVAASNSTFGQFNTAAPPRIMAFALKLRF